MPELRYLACGSTRHDLGRVLRGWPRGVREFPAGVFLYEDGERRILFDTGYAPQPWHAGPAGRLYSALLPPRVAADETADARLRALGVEPTSITHVVLSHLHPDHVGGARFFPQAQLLVHAGARAAAARPRLREGVLRALLPAALAERAVWVDGFAPGPHGLRTADPLGTGEFLLVELPGHARGHLGALVAGRVLLAGDAAWSRELLGLEHRLRRLPRAISADAGALAETAQRLLEAERAGIRLVFSHDPLENGQALL
jgi:glyoxylase-like metal-dependent hydrolase (beta-lactamase superfamily II)